MFAVKTPHKIRQRLESIVKETSSLDKLILALTIVYGVKRTRKILKDLFKDGILTDSALIDAISALKHLKSHQQ